MKMIAYTAEQDYDVDDPRYEGDGTYLAVWDAGRSYGEPEWSDSAALQLFRRIAWDQGHGEEVALEAANRYSRMFGDGTEVTLTTVRGHSQSDWWEVLAVGPYQESALKEFGMYLRGDVYEVTKHIQETCNMGHVHDVDTESLGGIYADSEEEAIAYAKEEME